jgi:hypothetical protein
MKQAPKDRTLKGEKTDFSDKVRIFLGFLRKKAVNTDF